MKRRDFHQLLAASAATAAFTQGPAAAQGGPVEGKDYVRLQTPAAVNLAAGKKIEVVEFFWYGCPHCNAFEPQLEAWLQRLPPDVGFRRVHVGFGPVHQTHQRLYYALEELGWVEGLHKKVFAAMHQQQQRLVTDADIAAFAKANGADGAKLVDTMKGFGATTKANRARQLSEAYKIDGVPALGIHGRFYTSGSLAGDMGRALAVTDFLIGRSRA